MIYPKFLKPGDCIGVPAVSDGAYDELNCIRFKNSIKKFNELGYKIVESKNLYNSIKGRSASGKERADEINKMFESKDIDFIMCAAGGEFIVESLPYIDFSKLVNNPKFVQGFSDPTGIMYVITTKYDIATIYSNNFKSFGMENWDDSLKNAYEIINGNIIEQNSFEKYEENSVARVTGLEGYNLDTNVYWDTFDGKKAEFSGRIIGGCLDNINELFGTEFDNTSDFIKRYKEDGIIWYFDNCEISLEGLIRVLWKFNQNGYFENCRGIVFGRNGVEKSYLGYTMKSALEDSVLSILNIPIVFNSDISHKGPTMTIINGAMANVLVQNGKGKIKLELK